MGIGWRGCAGRCSTMHALHKQRNTCEKNEENMAATTAMVVVEEQERSRSMLAPSHAFYGRLPRV